MDDKLTLKGAWSLHVSLAVLTLCNTDNSGNIAGFNYSVFAHKLESTRACDLNFIVKGDGTLKVTVSHKHKKVVISHKWC